MSSPEPPELPDYYQIPREETGINIRPSGSQEGMGQPPFEDLFTEQISRVLGEIRQFFIDWPAHIKAGLDTVIDWLQTVADLQLEWLRSLLHKIVDTTAAVFDVSSWVAFLDTAITSAANLVADSFATVFDWIASLLHGAVRFAENACNLDLTWLHNVIDDLLGWSTVHVELSSQEDFIDGINDGGFWNNIVDWMLGGSGSWLDDAIHAITNPINSFFDDVRRFINQMIEPWRIGYFDTNWAWVASLTTPTAALPGGADPVLTPGTNDGDGGALAPGVNTAIPAAPTNVSAIPFWDILVSGFPAGNITYAIAAVKSGVEGPATHVKTFVGTLFPPNSSTHVDLRWDAVSGASSYRVYRKVDGTYQATGWRLVASPASNGTLLAPVVDSTPRSGGTVAAPKTDAELAAQAVGEQIDVVDTKAVQAQAKADGFSAGTELVHLNSVPDLPGSKIVTPVPPRNLQVLPSGHVAASAPELLYAPNFGAAYGVGDDRTTFSDGVCEVEAVGGRVQAVYGNAVGCGVGQLITFMMDIEWEDLVFESRVTDTPVRMQVVAYFDGRPVQVLTLASIVPTTGTGGLPEPLRQMVQIGNGVNGIALRMIVGGGATAGLVRYTAPSVRQATRIASEAIAQVDFQIVTSPINNAAAQGGASVGSAIQETWDTMHAALGGDGGAGKTPADVAGLLTVINQTAVQALANSNANDQAIINLTASLNSAIDAITTLQQKVAVLESQAAVASPPTIIRSAIPLTPL
ncbi:hypothetical protein BST10_10050, partial [Mycolicibacter algericus DSM 45454]